MWDYDYQPTHDEFTILYEPAKKNQWTGRWRPCLCGFSLKPAGFFDANVPAPTHHGNGHCHA